MDYSKERLYLLLESQNPLVMKIIKDDLMQQQRERDMQLMLMRMEGVHMRMAPPIDTFNATELFNEGAKIIKDSSIPYDERGRWIKKHLSEAGYAALQDYANKESPEAREKVAKIIANAEEAYHFVKDGLPKYIVEVSKEKSKPYKIFLVDRFHTEKRYEVVFKSATARVLYIWFLLNAGKEMRYYVKVDNYLKRLYDDMQGREPKNFIWKNSLSDANTALTSALQKAGEGSEDRINTYLIDNKTFEDNIKVYSLQLPQKLIDSSVLESGSFRIRIEYKFEDVLA